ncbi:unnamed protein product [Phytophthora lilii]|uniref:Unnamed protein product n=1 Tax=Phytophthora lilii TaxID=2077276 RepID=A0A9W6WNZ8_9STRA|nr:unnamed protein product [Phytophthora lilii]
MDMTAKKRYNRDESSDEDDILKHLDAAFRCEQRREQQRSYRAHKKLKKDRTHFLDPVSPDVQKRCAQELQMALGAEGLDESACCVCDRLVLIQNIVRREDNDWRFIKNLQKILGTRDESLPDKLARQCHAPPHISGLGNVLVSPRGMHCYVDHNGYPSAWIDKQVEKVKKMHRIRNQHVKDVFNFYKTYNPLYSDVASDIEALATEYSEDVIEEHFVEHVQEAGNSLSDSISTELESVRGQTDAWALSNDDESTFLERRVGLLDDTLRVPADENQFISEVGRKDGTERSFLFRRSNQFSRDVNGDLFARLFPHLFPFGRGHPGERRRVIVSLKEAIKHYLALSSRQFAEDELFTLVAFDRLALQTMYIQNSVRCAVWRARFVTLTPNIENSFVMAQYTGITPVQSCLTYWKLDCLVRLSFLKPVWAMAASARLFMRQVDAFIRYGLGIDPKPKKATGQQGLLGKVAAYLEWWRFKGVAHCTSTF